MAGQAITARIFRSCEPQGYGEQTWFTFSYSPGIPIPLTIGYQESVADLDDR